MWWVYKNFVKIDIKTNIVQIKTNLDYPSYTKEKNEVISDNGDLIILRELLLIGLNSKHWFSVFVFENNHKTYEIVDNSVSIQKTILEDKEYSISVLTKE